MAMIPRSPRTGLPVIPKRPPEPSTRCEEAPPPELLAGIAQFNVGDYWRCHETLETLWRGEPDPIRSLYQGILLIGVGYYHLRRGNRRGALVKVQQGVERLQPFRPACMRVDVEGLIRTAGELAHVLRTGAATDHDAEALLPSIRVAEQPNLREIGDVL
jgi:predicted metal-dependent hydrolase